MAMHAMLINKPPDSGKVLLFLKVEAKNKKQKTKKHKNPTNWFGMYYSILKRVSFFFLKKDFIYLFMRDTQRGRDTGRGRSRFHAPGA